MTDLYADYPALPARIPRSKEEFESRYHRHAHAEGVGVTGLTLHVPCPFCAAPDWMVHRMVDTQRAYRQGAMCAECGRSAHAEFEVVQGYTSIRMVQTGGRKPQEWIAIERAKAVGVE